MLLIVEVPRDDSPSFETFAEHVECEGDAAREASCFEISVINVGRSPGRARCTWIDGAFTTGVIASNTHGTRTLTDVTTDLNALTIACSWARPTG